MSKIFISMCVCLFGVAATQDLSVEEAFFLKRVTEFWKDRDFALVKTQIQEFLEGHPQSTIHSHLYAIIGDIFYQEKDYKSALANYEKISDSTLEQKILCRKCQCLYLLGNFDAVIAILTPVVETGIDQKEEMKFLLGDSLFRKSTSLEGIEQNDFLLQAKPLLLSLYETSYQDKVLFPLAEVHKLLDENREAASLYLCLLEKMPDRKEELLLQIASLQARFDKNKAIETYQKVTDLGQAKASEAAYNELIYLFQENRFSELVHRGSTISSLLPEDKKSLFHFCMGRSHFKLDQYTAATLYFEKYIQEENESTPYKRAAFLTLIICAQKTQNGELFDRTLEQFVAAFPKDEEAGKALLLHAQTSLQNGDVEQATTDLKRLLTEFPDIPEKETLMYDHAILLCKMKKWNESRSAFFTFLQEFPASPNADISWHSIVHCSIQDLKENSTDLNKIRVVDDLHKALDKSTLFSPEERSNYQFLLGQLFFELGQYEESLSSIVHFISAYPQHPLIPEALLLQANLHYELQSPPMVLAEVSEKALKAASDSENKKALRLQLFNTYLALKEYDKAAEHLYYSYTIDEAPIHIENQVWLAHHLLNGDSKDNRAFQLYKKILQVDDNFALHFDPEHTLLEPEAIRFSELLSNSDKKNLLTSLKELQEKNGEQPWKYQDRVLFELGKIALDTKDPNKALEFFEEVIGKSKSTSYYAQAAQLEKNRILLSKCEEKTDLTPVLTTILSNLKDLQIQKKLSHEPLYLEAALEYADVRIGLSPIESRFESAIFFLNRIKDDFNDKTDATSREYQESRLRFPEKDVVFQNYMKCIEAEILCYEARLAKEQNDIEKAKRSQEVALTLLEEILKDEKITGYLKNRAEANLMLLR